MADLTMTPTTVVSGAGAQTSGGIAGEALTAGQAVYRKADGKIYKAKCAGTPEEAAVVGIALNAASLNQPVDYQSEGVVSLGATTIKTTTYVLSAASGGICPQADLIATQRLVYVGYARDLTGTFQLMRSNTGVTL